MPKSAEEGGTCGSGGSRAARKRQKKRRQQQKPVQALVKASDNDKSNDGVEKRKRAKLPVPSKINESSLSSDKIDDAKDATGLRSPYDILFGDEGIDEVEPAMDRARALLQSLLGADVSVGQFYREYWEKKCLHVARNDVRFFEDILSKSDIEDMIKNKNMKYGVDLNVTKCDKSERNGDVTRLTLDPLPDSGKIEDAIEAKSTDVWTNFENGCSVRLLCPHLHSPTVHHLLSLLESEFGCMVGANAYLTPGKASQGFSPHYDDIEAIILQLEGKKRWKIYHPVLPLPRDSSRDFNASELSEPIMDVVLEAGDVLYMPRGWIHQAVTLRDNEHSLHLTVSTMQHWSWADFLEILMPNALQTAIESESSSSLREALPRNFLSYMGFMHDTNEDYDRMINAQRATTTGDINKKEGSCNLDDDEIGTMTQDELEELKRKEIKKLQKGFREKAKAKIMKVAKEALAMVDGTCDEIGKRFLSDRLPPALIKAELEGTFETGTKRISSDTLCRMAREGVARLVLEKDDKAVLYHCIDNSLRFHGNPLSPLEFELEDAPAIEQLITTIEPDWLCVNDLIHDDVENRIAIAQALYDEGFITIKLD